MLVEDNPGDARLIREYLTASDIAHFLHVAYDGDEALAFLNREGDYTDAPRPDLILLDLNLPGKNGHELLAIIKATDGLRIVPVIVFTSSELDEDICKAYSHNANCYVAKSADPTESMRMIESMTRFWLTSVKLPVEGLV